MKYWSMPCMMKASVNENQQKERPGRDATHGMPWPSSCAGRGGLRPAPVCHFSWPSDGSHFFDFSRPIIYVPMRISLHNDRFAPDPMARGRAATRSERTLAARDGALTRQSTDVATDGPAGIAYIGGVPAGGSRVSHPYPTRDSVPAHRQVSRRAIERAGIQGRKG